MAAPENDDRPAVSESTKAVSEYPTTPISHSPKSPGSQFGILSLDPSDSSPDYDIVHAKPTSQNQLKEDQYQLPAMAPPPRRDPLHKDHFAFVFGSAKTQNYYDPAAKGPGSHTIRTLAWNPTGQLIATGSADRTLRIWNPERANVRYSTELRGHTAGIEKVLFNPVRDAELASCSTDGTVRFWDVRSKTCVSKLDVGGEAFTLSWSADGTTMIVGTKDDTLIPISVECPSTVTSHPDGANALNLPLLPTRHNNLHSPRSTPATRPNKCHNLLLVKILSYPSFNVLYTINAHTSACNAVALAPTGRYLAIGASDALISLWDTTDWICQRTLSSENGGAIRGVSWSFDGRYICGACDELGCGGNGLEIFHAESGDSIYTIPTAGANAGVSAVAWHPSRYWLAYSTTTDGPGSSSSGGLKIVGAAGGGL
ncbi:uncharacterized protein N7446_011263 [Penicillium canescens]|uniref:uncharacterized protein n=1 Tax=Penicillium canescens TaxID=5083 RepID=UPI0026DFCA6A|nr:uncharacterized protein N7446_011263 [Penicillium canescens]KAJ6048580.1 hypothetical protein N7446_011263 [Penicillium canescens]KAJ6173363.1 hypothetical protein N7485_006175 [Penicillium canescens]